MKISKKHKNITELGNCVNSLKFFYFYDILSVRLMSYLYYNCSDFVCKKFHLIVSGNISRITILLFGLLNYKIQTTLF